MVSLRGYESWARVAAALWLVACDGSHGGDAGADGGRRDAGPDAAAIDAGPRDAGPDAGPAPPGDALADDVCAHDGAVAVAEDGARAAYVTCGAERAVWTIALFDGAPIRIDDAVAQTTVRFSPNGTWLLYGPPTAMRLRPVDASSPAVVIGSMDEARFVVVDPTASPEVRLLVLASAGGGRRITMRSDADGFIAEANLADDPGIRGDLSLVSGSRNTLLFVLETAGAQSYQRVATDGASAAAPLPIDPRTTLYGPVALGDTHGIAETTGGGLAFVEMATGTAATLESDGVVAGSPRFDVVDGSLGRFAYYLRNGSITRTLRDGSGTPTTLRATPSSDLALSLDATRLVFSSGGRLSSIALDGSGEVELMEYGATTLDVAFSPDGAEVAAIDDGALTRAPIATASMSDELEPSGVVSGSAAYDGGGRLVYRAAADAEGHADVLRAAGATSSIAWNVDGWWPVDGNPRVIYRTRGGRLLAL
ncbi:MAG: hypothetical protein AB7S26_22595 [Sandaracinaceae bacterium]